MSAEEIFKDLGVSVKSKSVDLNWRMIWSESTFKASASCATIVDSCWF
jgi:hypothetical protein